MGRSVKKGVYIDEKLLKKVIEIRNSGRKEIIKTWYRRSTVIPEMVGMTLAVHNGRKFIPIFITENMVGLKLGEFSETRTFRGHTSKDNKAKV
jgi:small subunit ribosomal protein S19